MRFTTLYPLKNPAIQLKPGRSAPELVRARRLQITLVVAGTLGPLLFAPVTTFSLELGEASIKSGLGQSLVVEIPYRLASNERLSPACISLVPAAQAANALPTYTQVRRISLSSTHIEIFDDKSVREPLIGLNISVHCTTAPHFVRSYQLFVDPPARIPLSFSTGAAVAGAGDQPAIDAPAPPPFAANRIPSSTVTTAVASGTTANAPTTTTARANPSPRARGQAGGDLTQGQTYRVVRGDTLSGIAARVADRPATIRETADAIFVANPEAFTRGNRDLLKEGRSITVPIMAPAAATPAVLAAPTALPAVRDADTPVAAPVPTVAPAAASPTQPLPAADAVSLAAPVAIEPLPASAAVVEPRIALAPAAGQTELATETPRRTIPSAWLIGLLALGVVCLLSAPLAFVRRRKQHAPAELQTPRPRPLVEPAAGIEVVEGPVARPPSRDEAASTGNAKLEPVTASGAILPADPNDPAPILNPTDPIDLNVGAPVVMNERVDWFAARATAPVIDAASGDETIEENTVTARMPSADAAMAAGPQSPQAKPNASNPPIDDEQMTLTIVEMDMLRQDYEAQHTLTQHTSEALYDALAALNATKAARAAAAANSTLELPQLSEAETTDSTARLPTARVRIK